MAEERRRTVAGYPLERFDEGEWIAFKLHLRSLPVSRDDKRMALQEGADFSGRRLTERDYLEAGVILLEPLGTPEAR